jgi:arylsulfatase A-like enzyme
MKRLGYRTFGVADNINIGDEMGFSRGFDRFERHPYESALTLQKVVNEWRGEILSVDKYFLYLHFIDPHTPYRGRKEFLVKGSARGHVESLEAWDRGTPGQRRWVEENLALYDSEIGLVDKVIGELVETFGWQENTLLILTADHGEEFYDHGNRYHGDRLYQELVRVPLMVYFPDRFSPARVAANVGIIDIVPTIREFLGDVESRDTAGRSLLPLLAGESENPSASTRPLFGLYRNEHPDLEQAISRSSVVLGKWKYIRLTPENREELYDLSLDPAEQRDVADQHPDVVQDLRQQLKKLDREMPRLQRSYYQVDGQDEEMNKHLRALGYVE